MRTTEQKVSFYNQRERFLFLSGCSGLHPPAKICSARDWDGYSIDTMQKLLNAKFQRIPDRPDSVRTTPLNIKLRHVTGTHCIVQRLEST